MKTILDKQKIQDNYLLYHLHKDYVNVNMKTYHEKLLIRKY